MNTSERSKQKSRKTYLGYRAAVNLFVACCKKTYFDEISRDDTLDFLYYLRTRPSEETGTPIGESTAFNYFLEAMVFLNDRDIGKYVPKEDRKAICDQSAARAGSGVGRNTRDCHG